MASINFQVVWGKVKGYPWWPGVIDFNDPKTQAENDATLSLVQFIGENTQYTLISAYLSSKHIQDFEKNCHKHSNTTNNVTSTKHLLNCITAAQELADGTLFLPQLKEINQRLMKTKCTSYTKINKEIAVKITELKRLISYHDYIELETAGFDAFKHYEAVLSEISKEKSIESKVQQLCEVLIELAKKKINKKMLKRLEIENLLTAISQCCSDSPFEKVKEIGNQVLSLKKTWGRHRKSIGCVDVRLKGLVCRKISLVMQVNGFQIGMAQGFALEIEEKMRKYDPSMELEYRKCFQKMIRDIREMKYEDYASVTVQSV